MSLKETPTYRTFCNRANKSSSLTKEITLNSEESNIGLSSMLTPSRTTLKEFEGHKEDILDLIIEDAANYNVGNCLEGHNLNPNDRADAIDWMLGKVIKLQCSKLVFFKSVAILDLFYTQTTS
jgi:hypothetical protein